VHGGTHLHCSRQHTTAFLFQPEAPESAPNKTSANECRQADDRSLARAPGG